MGNRQNMGWLFKQKKKWLVERVFYANTLGSASCFTGRLISQATLRIWEKNV
jgi:hypothetical protein